MKQLAVEAVGHLYLILRSRRCIIKSRKKHGFPAQKLYSCGRVMLLFCLKKENTKKAVSIFEAAISNL